MCPGPWRSLGGPWRPDGRRVGPGGSCGHGLGAPFVDACNSDSAALLISSRRGEGDRHEAFAPTDQDPAYDYAGLGRDPDPAGGLALPLVLAHPAEPAERMD